MKIVRTLNLKKIYKYLINQTTAGLIYNNDGGLTIYIQHKRPEGKKAANWLPAHAEPSYLAMRIYGPEERVINNKLALLVEQRKNSKY